MSLTSRQLASLTVPKPVGVSTHDPCQFFYLIVNAVIIEVNLKRYIPTKQNIYEILLNNMIYNFL